MNVQYQTYFCRDICRNTSVLHVQSQHIIIINISAVDFRVYDIQMSVFYKVCILRP